jgi:hypothetical protein
MAVRSQKDWAKVTLGRTSSLVLGWRRGGSLDAGRLALGSDMDKELRNRARSTIGEIANRTARAYEHSALLEDDEVFLLTSDQLPSRIHRKGRPFTEEEEDGTSALIDLLSNPIERRPLAADDVRGRAFLFYAAVFRAANSVPIAFIKYHNAGSVLKTGRLVGLLGQTVTRVEEPILIFESDFDLVIDGTQIASLRPNAIVRLFADLEVAAAAVPEHLKTLAGLPVGLSAQAEVAISAACSKRRLLARRLEFLVQQPHLQTLTIADVEKYLKALRVNKSRFIKEGTLSVAEADVSELLDILDQLDYRGGYDDKLRRAERASIVNL